MEPKLVVLFGCLSIISALYLLSFKICVAIFALLITVKLIQHFVNRDKNPLAQDARKPRKPYVIDQRKRDQVIKQSFNIDKVGIDFYLNLWILSCTVLKVPYLHYIRST